MFTWNFQYISKARLAETFGQLMLNPQRGDILVRIHTAIHSEKEAVELAGFIKSLVPAANIIGMSTPAPISQGRIMLNQCSISVTQMAEGTVRTAMLMPDASGKNVRDMFADDDIRLLLTFFAGRFREAEHFANEINEELPGVSMAGGIVGISDNAYQKDSVKGFVFNEAGWSSYGILMAAYSGSGISIDGGYATGLQAVKIDEQDNAALIEDIKKSEELSRMISFTDDGKRMIGAADADGTGDLSMAFLHEEAMISDDRKLFRQIEGFQMTEDIFGYICSSRVLQYPGCSEWELSAYENSDINGCITNGVFVRDNGRNVLSDLAFAVTALGEDRRMQRFNPYVFSYTEALSGDNDELISSIMNMKKSMGEGSELPKSIQDFIGACEEKLLRTADEGLKNEAALMMDMRLKGYDRVCIINVMDVLGITSVFSANTVKKTKNNYMNKCRSFTRDRKYHIYKLDKWQLAVSAPAYMVKLSVFISDMEELQRELFKSAEGTVAIVPTFCILDDCDPEYLFDNYNSACNRMQQKNLQFYVYNAESDKSDVSSIRERYRIVDVINYAIENDMIFPYYQGIYDNRKGSISHYEALIRIKDETGRVYFPAEFLDVARTYGLLYDQLSRAMIHKVFEKFSGYEDKSVSINLSMRDIKNQELAEYICDFLTTAQHPENFVFEILENEDVDDYENVLSFVDRIHSLGGRISIDDFGSGYSNLLHVISIHADYIKIDGSIVSRCSADKESEYIIAMIAGWRKLSSRNVGIVAEFVENEDIQKMIENYGIDYSQGYLFSKPAPDI